MLVAAHTDDGPLTGAYLDLYLAVQRAYAVAGITDDPLGVVRCVRSLEEATLAADRVQEHDDQCQCWEGCLEEIRLCLDFVAKAEANLERLDTRIIERARLVWAVAATRTDVELVSGAKVVVREWIGGGSVCDRLAEFAHQPVAAVAQDAPVEPTARRDKIVIEGLRARPGEFVPMRQLDDLLQREGLAPSARQAILRLRGRGWPIAAAPRGPGEDQGYRLDVPTSQLAAGQLGR